MLQEPGFPLKSGLEHTSDIICRFSNVYLVGCAGAIPCTGFDVVIRSWALERSDNYCSKRQRELLCATKKVAMDH